MKAKSLKIRLYGNSGLRVKSTPVGAIDAEIGELARNMIDAMFAYDGVGLAAPQVGHNVRVIALGLRALPPEQMNGSLSPGEALLLPRMPLAIVNPEILAYGPEKIAAEEGCLSVPSIYADVFRPSEIDVRFTTLNGETISTRCGGWLARVFQHEIDHLDGVLFVDKTSPEISRNIQGKLERLKRRARTTRFLRNLLSHGDKKDELC